ncbi:hypothetical protein STEG23_035808, partial [Scotinomys teguina]
TRDILVMVLSISHKEQIPDVAPPEPRDADGCATVPEVECLLTGQCQASGNQDVRAIECIDQAGWSQVGKFKRDSGRRKKSEGNTASCRQKQQNVKYQYATSHVARLTVVSGAPTAKAKMEDEEDIAYTVPEIRDPEMLIVGSTACFVVTPHHYPLPGTLITYERNSSSCWKYP